MKNDMLDISNYNLEKPGFAYDIRYFEYDGAKYEFSIKPEENILILISLKNQKVINLLTEVIYNGKQYNFVGPSAYMQYKGLTLNEEVNINNCKNCYSKDGVLYVYNPNYEEYMLYYYPVAKKDKLLIIDNKVYMLGRRAVKSLNNNEYLKYIVWGDCFYKKVNNQWFII